LERRGIPVTFFTAKRILRRQLPLGADTFIAGDIDAMHGAMLHLKIEVPAPDDYPESLRAWLHRRVWRSTLTRVEREILDGVGEPVFAKPADRRKSFIGRVFGSIDDFREIGGVSRREDVWCSEVVSWISEYRVYVIGARIVSIDHYAGDPAVPIDVATVEAALRAYRAAGEAPAGYGIDFGVLTSERTALVEANDGYSLGAYQIGAEEYTDLLFARWAELVGSRALAGAE
jgi:hypothetical protein